MTTANPNPQPATVPGAATAAPGSPAADTRDLHGVVLGVVTSDKRSQTRTVIVSFQYRDRKYGKYLHHRTRCQVHDPQNQCHLGDWVEIVNCRPISKTKNWRLVRVVQKSAGQLEHVTEVETK
jgi:small subunit ribosomal protein S17